MMKPDSKKVVFDILNAKHKLVDDYICLPKDKWMLILNDFKAKMKATGLPISLDPIELRVVVSYEADVKQEKKQAEVIEKAMEMFDKTKVNIKENE